MKKFLSLILVVVLLVVLGACSKGYPFSFEITATNPGKNNFQFDYKLIDDSDALTTSELTYNVYNDADESVANGVLKLENYLGTCNVTGLTEGKKYSLIVTTGYQGKAVTLVKYSFETSTKGTTDAPFEISTLEEFKTLLVNNPSSSFKLVADIDFEGAGAIALFSSSNAFTGIFDGNGYTIMNFAMGTPEEATQPTTTYVGLFGYVGAGAEIKNVKLDNFNCYYTRTSKTYYGLLAGYNAGAISNITVTNSVLSIEGTYSEFYVAGLVGINALKGTVDNCTVEAAVSGKTLRSLNVAGIVAVNEQPTTSPVKNVISNCTFKGSIKAVADGTSSSIYSTYMRVGGIIALNFATVKDCAVEASIEVNSHYTAPSKNIYNVFVGGLVGQNVCDASSVLSSSAKASFNVTTTDAKDLSVGALIGRNGGDGASARPIAKNLTYHPAEQANVINYSANVTLHAGLIGNDLTDTSIVSTASASKFTSNVLQAGTIASTSDIEIK